MIEKKLKTIIIDDAQRARRLLFLILKEQAPNIEVIAEASNADDAYELIKTHSPDFILLDIEMPGKSGIELVEMMNREKLTCNVIFTTAYNEYAIKAFRLSALDYILKPINERELLQAIEKVEKQISLKAADKRLQFLAQNMKSGQESKICIPVLNGFEYISILEIEYVEASGSYSNIVHTKGKQIMVSKNLKFFEEVLQPFNQFYRVHRSCLINMNEIRQYVKSEQGAVILKSGKTVNVARERRGDFLNILNGFNL